MGPVATKMNQTAGGSCQHTALAAGRSAYRRQSITTSHAARLKACPDTNPCRQTEKAATQVETLSGRLSPLPKSRAKPRNRLRAPLEQRCGLGWAPAFEETLSLDFLFFAQCASVFPDHTDFLPSKASILDRHPKKRVFVSLVVGGKSVLMNQD